jgi:hypothetical protein
VQQQQQQLLSVHDNPWASYISQGATRRVLCLPWPAAALDAELAGACSGQTGCLTEGRAVGRSPDTGMARQDPSRARWLALLQTLYEAGRGSRSPSVVLSSLSSSWQACITPTFGGGGLLQQLLHCLCQLGCQGLGVNL